MKRLTTDNPKNNIETLMNYCYSKDGNAILRYAESEHDIDLCTYTAKCCHKQGCDHQTAPKIMEYGLECDDCMVAVMYYLGVQSAETRARLMKYENNPTIIEPYKEST